MTNLITKLTHYYSLPYSHKSALYFMIVDQWRSEIRSCKIFHDGVQPPREFWVQLEVDKFDLPSRKLFPRTKHDVDPMICCRNIAIRNFQNERSVGRSVVNTCMIRRRNITRLISYTPLFYVRNVACEE